MDITKYENKIYVGDNLDILKSLPDNFVDCCVTSPPYYGLRDYGISNQIGLEETPEEYISKLVEVFREVKRVLKNDGTLWLNIGDSYAGSGKGRNGDGSITVNENSIQAKSLGTINGILKKSNSGEAKPKDLIGIPWMLAFALRKDGWYLRQDIIWAKNSVMPEPVKDRCTKSHEYIFLLSKQAHYYFDYLAIQEPIATSTENKKSKLLSNITEVETRNKRDVWTVSPARESDSHFAIFPETLITPCILAGSRKDGIVLDPFFGSGTTGKVAFANGRKFLGIELNPEYVEIEKKKITNNYKWFVEYEVIKNND